MEYLTVVGISLFLITPMIVAFYHQSASLEEDIRAAQLDKATRELISAAEEVHYHGPPSQKRLDINLPPDVNDITLQGDTIAVTYEETKKHYATARPDLNLTGTIKPTQGRHTITITARQDTVEVNDDQ
ncbi:MAG: hypothetical protein ACLFO2_02105 [Candidatus Woesearchaeota archaeon]